MVKARIRGVYATALTKLLLSNGFEIVQPSLTIRERFGLKDVKEFPDVRIEDRDDLQGIRAIGNAEAVNRLKLILQSNLEDVVVRKWPFGVDTSYGGLIEEVGVHRLNVEFPALSKKKLDELRALVVPTLDGHHRFKASGGRIASALEMAEKLLEKGAPRREVEELFVNTVMNAYPTEGSTIHIEHVKLNGKVFHLGKAFVEEFNNTHIRFRRVFERSGVYDGLETPKEAGDYAITEATLGEWHFKTSYFSRSGKYKGSYININTPIELYPFGIRYVDLEIDVCVWPDGKVKTLDEESLERAVAVGIINEKLADTAKRKVREILSSLSRPIRE